MKKYLIIYHKEDNDGAMSCALVLYWLYNVLNVSKTDVDYIGVNYNDLANMWDRVEVQYWHEKYEHLIMTDISFGDIRIMKMLWNNFGDNFTWVDHHAPIINESIISKVDGIQGIRDTSRSAILNMYRYLYDPLDITYNAGKCPEILRVLSAWDSFTFEREGYTLDYVSRVNKAFNVKYKISPAIMLDDLLSDIIMKVDDEWVGTIANTPILRDLHEQGYIIDQYDSFRFENLIRTSGDLDWTVNGDRTACALFMQGQSSSDWFTTLKGSFKNGIVFKRMVDGNWGVSLYNIDFKDATFHCGDYMRKKYKGGGHSGAAGCVITEAQFKKLLKTKQF